MTILNSMTTTTTTMITSMRSRRRRSRIGWARFLPFQSILSDMFSYNPYVVF
uniref:Uncharacterized protein n=1 Tax=Arundo donax TaxID=35708 RepID=A0A0A9GBZ5_ARUDO